MPAESQSQQKAAGMALAAKKGEMDPDKLKGAAKDMYESMSKDELEDYAETSHEDKPEKKKASEDPLFVIYSRMKKQQETVSKTASEIAEKRVHKISDTSDNSDDEYMPEALNLGDLFLPEKRAGKKTEMGQAYSQETGEKAPYAFRKPKRRESQVQIPAVLAGGAAGGVGGYSLGNYLANEMGYDASSPADAALGPRSTFSMLGAGAGTLLGGTGANLIQHLLHKSKSEDMQEDIKREKKDKTPEERERIKEETKEKLQALMDKHVEDWDLVDYLGGMPGTTGNIEAAARRSGKEIRPGAEKNLGTLLDAVMSEQGNPIGNVSLIRDKLKDRYVDPESESS